MSAATSESSELPVVEGQILEGKFRIERILGQGSMGLVVEATHLALDERVALKFLRPAALARPDIVARFSREARSAVKIKSDHVARVFDVGMHEASPFIVMEYLEGSDLGSVLENRRKLDVSEAVDYVIQACEGLAEAHARGIVHRDIKPENLFLTKGAGFMKTVKILDFGISKVGLGPNGEVDLTTHDTTQIMGSPHYMSPEQIRCTRDVDARADLWSLGVVLFELVAGSVPFAATELTPLISEILHDPHQRLRSLQPDAPEALEAVVDRCLCKDPEDRFQSAADLAMALIPFAPKHARSIAEKVAEVARSSGGVRIGGDDSLPPPAPLSPPPFPMIAPLTAPTFSPFPAAAQTSPSLTVSARPEGPPRRLPIIASVFALLLLGGAIAFIVTTGSQAAAERPPPVTAAPATAEAASVEAPPPHAPTAAPATPLDTSAAAASAEAIPTTTTRAPAAKAKTPRAPIARPSSTAADAAPVVGQEIRRTR